MQALNLSPSPSREIDGALTVMEPYCTVPWRSVKEILQGYEKAAQTLGVLYAGAETREPPLRYQRRGK